MLTDRFASLSSKLAGSMIVGFPKNDALELLSRLGTPVDGEDPHFAYGREQMYCEVGACEGLV